jgi:hypothetical protein
MIWYNKIPLEIRLIVIAIIIFLAWFYFSPVSTPTKLEKQIEQMEAQQQINNAWIDSAKVLIKQSKDLSEYVEEKKDEIIKVGAKQTKKRNNELQTEIDNIKRYSDDQRDMQWAIISKHQHITISPKN